MSPASRSTLFRTAGVYFLTTLAVAFPFVFGRLLWPDGLSAGAEHLFWPAAASAPRPSCSSVALLCASLRRRTRAWQNAPERFRGI